MKRNLIFIVVWGDSYTTSLPKDPALARPHPCQRAGFFLSPHRPAGVRAGRGRGSCCSYAIRLPVEAAAIIFASRAVAAFVSSFTLAPANRAVAASAIAPNCPVISANDMRG